MILKLGQKVFWSLTGVALCFSSLAAEELYVRTREGVNFFLDVDKEEDVQEIKKQIELVTGVAPELQILIASGVILGDMEIDPALDTHTFYIDFYSPSAGDPPDHLQVIRVYEDGVTEDEFKDIKSIVTTLANTNTVALLAYKKKLEAAGDRIDHVHPLRFLESVFIDEEMKVGIRNIKKKKWVWKDFMKGLEGSLADEASKGNITDAHIEDLAITLGIKSSIISTPVKKRKWNDLVAALIKNVPRGGDPDRYDI